MPDFRYRAIDDSGRLCRGSATALSEGEVAQILLDRGLNLIDCRKSRRTGLTRAFSSGRIPPRLLIEFYHRLSQALRLGLPMLAALEENASTLPSPMLKKIIGEMRLAIAGGQSLQAAAARFGRIFPKLDLAVIGMGEKTGELPKSLQELADFREWKEDIRATLRRATVYPAFVLTAVTAVLGVWVGYVLPQMAKVLAEMGVILPQATRWVLGVSGFLRQQWVPLGAGLGLLAVAFLLARKSARGAVCLDRLLLGLPLAGPIAVNIVMARLSHNFATMYHAGLNIHQIFEILSRDVLGNRFVEKRVGRVYSEVQGGKPLAAAFEGAGGFPPLLLGAIRNGESTGTLDEAFNRLGDYYNGEVKRTMQLLVNALEPISILALGGIFGLILLSILLPLYDVIGEFGKAY
ncbi:MAG: type II secretion system F family protein [Desulfobacteraceae bacterium]|nr:type II secretion system F family protein [Desulfobacteraceae bacterium]